VKERALETFVVEIAGEPVMAFRAENEEEAQELVNGDDSGRGGIKTVLSQYSREDGKPLWDGASELTARAASQAEHNEWEELRDAAIESDDGPDDFNAFLIPIIDPQEDENGDTVAV
jgi:hypothetical protein